MNITMSQTDGQFTSGQTYIVRAKEGERLIAATKATKATLRGPAANVSVANTGKRAS